MKCELARLWHQKGGGQAVLGGLLGLAGLHSAAQAQGVAADDAVPLPEVTITAQRTESVLRKTPVSVGVVNEVEIARKGVYQLNDIVGVIAGVAVPNGSSNMPQAVGIRGVGVSIPAMSQAVGIYVDDVPMVRGYGTGLWDLPDIERIEVLRGPQGTLYGQNLTAGAVKFVSIDPSAAQSAFFSASAGNHGALEARGYANGAVGSESLSASLAFSRRSNEGLGYNATLQRRVDKLDATQFRAKLRWAMAPGIDTVLAVDGLQDRSDASASSYPLNTPDAAPRVTFTSSPEAGAFKRNAGGLSAKVTARLDDGLVVRSITGLRTYQDDPTKADFGGLAVQRYTLDQVVEQSAFSQELQLQGRQERWAWTTGLMVVADRFDFDRFVTAFPLTATSRAYTEALSHQKTTDLGVYGQARYAASADTGFTAGLRLYNTRQTAANAFWRTDAAQTRTAQVYSASDLAVSKSGLLPRVGVDHQWTPDTFVYASVAQGAKFGGFNRAAESAISASVATRPEKVTAYEAGSKGRYLDGRITVNAAVFYNDYRDYLAALNNSTVNGVLVTDSVLVNAGKAHTYGVDVEVAARLAARTDWTLSMELLRSRFEKFANPTGAAVTNYVGHELPYAPKVTLGSSLSHVESLDGGGEISLNGSLRYLASQFADVANAALLQLPSQTYVDLGAAYLTANHRWTFALRVKNLTNKTYALLRSRIPPLGVDAAYYNPPRTVLVTARYDF
jgi:iron complex outermembrane recepter protein